MLKRFKKRYNLSAKVAHCSRNRFAQFRPLLHLSLWQVINHIITFIVIVIITIIIKSYYECFLVVLCLFLGRTPEPFNFSLIHWGRIARWNNQYDDDDDEIINTMKMMMMILSLPGEWREWRVHGDTVNISVSSMHYGP